MGILSFLLWLLWKVDDVGSSSKVVNNGSLELV